MRSDAQSVLDTHGLIASGEGPPSTSIRQWQPLPVRSLKICVTVASAARGERATLDQIVGKPSSTAKYPIIPLKMNKETRAAQRFSGPLVIELDCGIPVSTHHPDPNDCQEECGYGSPRRHDLISNDVTSIDKPK